MRRKFLIEFVIVGFLLFGVATSVFAVCENMFPLRDILNASVAGIPKADKMTIPDKWIAYFSTVDLRWLWWLLGGCGVLTFVVIVWNLLLRRQVERRRMELQEELQRRTCAEQFRQQAEEQFRHVIEFCPLGVLMYRLENNGRLILTAGNTAAERILCIEIRPLLGRTIEEAFPGLARTDVPERYRRICKNGIPWETHLFSYEDEHVRGMYEIYAFQTSAGQMAVMFTEISERIHAEQAREKLMSELQAKNEELEGIIFIASHDLRSPLINIQGFAGELQKSCREMTVLLGREALSETNSRAIRRILDEDIPESLSFISAGTGKMDSLVKGLLCLARIGTTQMRIEPIDMNRLMATILKTVQYQMREHDIEIRAVELPPCRGDWVQLNQVFSNLIDNAIKYRHPNRRAVIEIRGSHQGNRAQYAVSDNGIGVAPEHNKKIFEIFHRLNPGGPIKGEGLGLTIVQRILDRLDGKVCVESEPDVGATFIIELPAV